MTIHITSARRKQEEREIEALYPYRQPPYPADPNKFGNGTKVVCGVVIPDSRPTVEQQSACRGEVPTVNRDYSHYYPAGLEQTVSPTGGLCEIRECARTQSLAQCPPKRPAVSAVVDLENPHHTARTALEAASRNGDTVNYATYPIPVDLYSREPIEIIEWHLRRAFHDIGYWRSWAIDRKVELPYGFWLARDDEYRAKVYATYRHQQKNGAVYYPSTEAVYVGMLTNSQGWTLYSESDLRLRLDKIEKIRKQYKLNNPNPTPPRPRNPSAKKVYEETGKDRAA